MRPWRSTLAVGVVAVTVMVGAPSVRANVVALEEGLGLLENWQLEDALGLAQRLLLADPTDPDAMMLAGYVQFQRGEHQSALALLDAARDAGVDTGYVHDLVAGTAGYGAHFERLDTDHFSIRYLNKDEIVAHYAAPVLEDAYRRIGKELEFFPAERGEKIVVEIFPDARGLAGATGLTVKEISTSGTIAVCKFHRLMITSPLATTDGYGWADTLAHEYLHLVISKKSHNSIPIWLHEGIAKYYESAWNGAAGRALEPFSEKLLADALKDRKLITYDEMHPSMAKLPSQEAAALAFAEVFTTIEFLTTRYGPSTIPRVLELTGEGVELERALLRVYKLNLRGVEAAWRKWLPKRRFTIVPGAKPRRITLAQNEAGRSKEKPLETIEDREVHDFARLGEMLHMRGHVAAAVKEYEKAYARAGNRYPTVAYRLARAYSDVGSVKPALKVLDQTLLVHPDSSDATILAGRLELKRKQHGAARRHFEQARLRNPFNPEIHQALALIYDKLGESESAQLERRMLELARKPRPTRSYQRPSPPAGNARLSLVSPGWNEVRVNAGEPWVIPTWRRPLAAGRHTLEYRTATGEFKTQEIEIEVGEEKVVVLR